MMRFTPRMISFFAAVMLAGLAGVGLGRLRANAAKGSKESPVVVRSAGAGIGPIRRRGARSERFRQSGAGVRFAGHRVVYDIKSSQTIRGINIAGTLSFATDRDTRLDVGLIKIQAGDEYSEQGFDCEAHLRRRSGRSASCGGGNFRAAREPQHTALIRLVYIDAMDRNSCPAIVCCAGRMIFIAPC